MSSLYDELLDRYKSTGRIGFSKPKNLDEALKLIDTIVELYSDEQEKEEEKEEEVVLSLAEITEQLKQFLKNFN